MWGLGEKKSFLAGIQGMLTSTLSIAGPKALIKKVQKQQNENHKISE